MNVKCNCFQITFGFACSNTFHNHPSFSTLQVVIPN